MIRGYNSPSYSGPLPPEEDGDLPHRRQGRPGGGGQRRRRLDTAAEQGAAADDEEIRQLAIQTRIEGLDRQERRPRRRLRLARPELDRRVGRRREEGAGQTEVEGVQYSVIGGTTHT